MKFNCSYKELIDINSPKLIPNPKNNNRHSIEQINRLSKIIDYQGQRTPIVISLRSGFIVKGHCRLEAIKTLNWDKIAVDFQDYENEAQEFADMTADNEIARWAEFDYHQFKNDFDELNIEGVFDQELFGLQMEIGSWEDDLDSIENIKETSESLPGKITITCKPDEKDEVLIYLKGKLMETSFTGVHIE